MSVQIIEISVFIEQLKVIGSSWEIKIFESLNDAKERFRLTNMDKKAIELEAERLADSCASYGAKKDTLKFRFYKRVNAPITAKIAILQKTVEEKTTEAYRKAVRKMDIMSLIANYTTWNGISTDDYEEEAGDDPFHHMGVSAGDFMSWMMGI